MSKQNYTTSFAVDQSPEEVLAAVNNVLSDLQTRGATAELARAAGVTYVPPREPAVLGGDLLLKILQK